MFLTYLGLNIATFCDRLLPVTECLIRKSENQYLGVSFSIEMLTPSLNW